MQKKTYQQPAVKVVVLEASELLAGSNEQLGDGGDIFSSNSQRSMESDNIWEN